MKVADFDYALPPERIAREPAPERAASRLLHLDGRSGAVADLHFRDLPKLVAPSDVVVLNDTRVLRARLHGRKATGGRVEVLVERILDEREAVTLVRAGHPVRPGLRVFFGREAEAEVLSREGEQFRLRFSEPVAALLERAGEVPLPPYIPHRPRPEDAERYQTVYAARDGSVAAPTAGLHFDHAMLAALRAQGVAIVTVTLHVGYGTFRPYRTETIEAHRMHPERYEVPATAVEAIARARAAGGRVLAVGTTVLRALESAASEGRLQPRQGETDLYVTPGFRFRVVERLLTNFHLPRSTLFVLACAFGGLEAVRRAYAHAIEAGYRFFSYGDAMLIERAA